MTIQRGFHVVETMPGTWRVANAGGESVVQFYRAGIWTCQFHGAHADCEHVTAVREHPLTTRCDACGEIACGQVRNEEGGLIALCPECYGMAQSVPGCKALDHVQVYKGVNLLTSSRGKMTVSV